MVMRKFFVPRKYRKFFFPVLFMCVACCLFSITASAQRKAHRHRLSGDAIDLVADEIKFVEVGALDKNLKRENLVRNRNYESFSVDDEKGHSHIFFADRKTKKIYEIRGIPLEYRPFSDLVWLGAHTLAFDRWANPHYGAHYEFDVKEKKLKRAVMFSGGT